MHFSYIIMIMRKEKKYVNKYTELLFSEILLPKMHPPHVCVSLLPMQTDGRFKPVTRSDMDIFSKVL